MTWWLRYFLYLAFSGTFLGILFLLAIFLEKKTKINKEDGRKIIHILFANWYFIPYFMVSSKADIWIAIVPPLIFLILNFLSYRFKLIKIIERDDRQEIGTLVYPFSMILALFLCNYVIEMPFIGLLAALILGYGDGLAGIIGRRYSKNPAQKSLFGFMTMLIVSSLITLPFVFIFQGYNRFYFALIIGGLAALFEYYASHGMDNLTIPMGVIGIYYFLITLIH